MQPSNTNKAFRGYANVVKDKNAMNIQVNQHLNQESGIELQNPITNFDPHTSGSSIGFNNQQTQSRFNN